MPFVGPHSLWSPIPSPHTSHPVHTSSYTEPFEHWFYIHEWAPLIIFFGTYLGIVRNKRIPHVARYHIMMVRDLTPHLSYMPPLLSSPLFSLPSSHLCMQTVGAALFMPFKRTSIAHQHRAGCLYATPFLLHPRATLPLHPHTPSPPAPHTHTTPTP